MSGHQIVLREDIIFIT